MSNLAVLVVGPGYRPSRALAVATRHGTMTRYDRRDIPLEVLGTILGALSSIGLVRVQAGKHHGPVTTVAPTAKMKRRLALHKVTLADVGRAPGGEVIILKASAGPKSPKVLVSYTDTDETARLRREMERINAFLNSQELTVDGERQLPVNLTRRFQIPELSADQSFDLHGRIYDGFWINMHRTDRPLLRINGDPIVDLDYTGMFTQLAYLHAGLPLPEGDPYGGVEGLEPDPIIDPHGLRRDAIKQGLNAFYFRSGRMVRLPAEVKRCLGSDWTATRFAAAIRSRHAPIKHLFGTGVGMKLMYTESCVLVRTLLDLIDIGVPALPMHDGIMVPVSSSAVALQQMGDSSRAVLGVALAAQEKPLLVAK